MTDLSEFTLWYYTSDDGIHVTHDIIGCDHDENLGFSATVNDAVAFAEYHVCKGAAS